MEGREPGSNEASAGLTEDLLGFVPPGEIDDVRAQAAALLKSGAALRDRLRGVGADFPAVEPAFDPRWDAEL